MRKQLSLPGVTVGWPSGSKTNDEKRQDNKQHQYSGIIVAVLIIRVHRGGGDRGHPTKKLFSQKNLAIFDFIFAMVWSKFLYTIHFALKIVLIVYAFGFYRIKNELK